MAKIDPLLTALVPVLADTCAIHTPIRRWPHGPHHVAIERLLDFREHGGLVYEVGGDAAERKRGERLATAWEGRVYDPAKMLRVEDGVPLRDQLPDLVEWCEQWNRAEALF